MRISVTAGSIRDALNRARQIIPSTPALLAYSGVFLQTSGDESLRLTASDGDSTMTIALAVEVAASGQVLVAPRPLLGLLASIPASTMVELALAENGDVVVSGEGINPYSFRPLSATFPIPTTPASGIHPERLAMLADALMLVRAAAGRDTPVIQVISDGDLLVLHATDGFRLARVALAGAGFGTFSGVLGLQVVDRAARMNPSQVTVDLKARTLAFRSDSVVLTTRMLATPFPAVETVLLNTPAAVTSCVASDVAASLSRLSAIAEQGTIALEFTGSELHLRASAAEVGAGHEIIALRTPVPSTFQLQLRAPYLADAVAAFGDGDVSIAYSGALQPLFLSGGTLPVTHVVMPVRG
jgi:DNA polymerase III sliding clamp (beta) subunit (PCNA family)